MLVVQNNLTRFTVSGQKRSQKMPIENNIQGNCINYSCCTSFGHLSFISLFNKKLFYIIFGQIFKVIVIFNSYNWYQIVTKTITKVAETGDFNHFLKNSLGHDFWCLQNINLIHLKDKTFFLHYPSIVKETLKIYIYIFLMTTTNSLNLYMILRACRAMSRSIAYRNNARTGEF